MKENQEAGDEAMEAALMMSGPSRMQLVWEIIERVAPTEATVLIEGETGTGKEWVARAIHRKSRRRDGPWVAVNCAALPDSIIESELFGHVKGAFTGAIADKAGRFALAKGGTLFLDEIAELSPMGQADLLRVLEDGIYRPLGSPRTVQSDVRIVAATNQSLAAASREGKFREDLLYRIEVVVVRLPPLRERRDEIGPLAVRLAEQAARRHGLEPVVLSAELLEVLCGLDWPGNIRQLRNAVERMVLLARRRVLRPEDWWVTGLGSREGARDWESMTLAEAEQELIRRALIRTGGNKAEAARRLGISRRSLHYRLKAWRSEMMD